MKHYFINLTNGIERIPELKDGVIHFVRVKSTTLEQKDFYHLFSDLDHNFYLHLALGHECIFVDYGTNRKNSKTCYQGIPLIKYILERRWFGKTIEAYRHLRHSDEKIYDQEKYYDFIYNDLFIHGQNSSKGRLKKKIDYYKRFLGSSINLTYLCSSTVNDGNYPLYSKLLKENY